MFRIEEFTRALFGLLTILLSSLMRKSRGITRAFGCFTRVLRGLLAEYSRRACPRVCEREKSLRRASFPGIPRVSSHVLRLMSQ